ncbi:hypothetical protein C0T31_02470 [Dysgonamonadaceae bacterium]|nr:hypothetical protein C0T31_02470 [Dysgonamonadaceae bacterium]
MRKTVFLLASLFVMVLATQRVNAQSTATATDVPATATIVAPISITKVDNLQFGKIIKSTTGGTVKIAASSNANPPLYTGGLSAFTGTNAVTAASFTVNGEVGYTYSISLPSSINITHTDGSTTMAVDDFTSTGGLLTGGTETLYVGATLNVGPNQTSGTYTGTFNVTVAYN